jgi:alpha-glucosidase
MARPVDSYHEIGYLAYAPKYVMFSGWVGDQNATSGGLGQALSNAMHSAWKGYLNFGFDIGGYRGNKDKVSKSVFLRWAQVGAMVPFMENGGNGLHEPWAFDKQTVEIYRKFVLLHHDLKSFFLTAGTEAYAKGKSVIEPLATKQGNIAFTLIDSYAYKLWETFLVFPILEDNNIADMKVPEGNWIYYFNHSYVLDKRIQAKAFPLD